MTNEKMEQRLAAALEKTAPDDVNGVLSRCEERKGTVIPMTTKKTANRKWTTLVAACLAVMLLGGGGVFYQRANAVASVVSLDVNPSIELKVNRSEKVLVCTPLNEDAKAILADMGNGRGASRARSSNVATMPSWEASCATAISTAFPPPSDLGGGQGYRPCGKAPA